MFLLCNGRKIIYPSTNYCDEKCSLSFCTSHLSNYTTHNLTISWSQAFIYDSMPPILVHASYFVSFPLLNKSIPTLTHVPLFFIMKNEGRTRIVTEPWNFLFTIQFVLRIQTHSQDTHLTHANCEPVWSSFLGSQVPYSFPPPHCSQTPETVPVWTWKGWEMEIWQCPLPRSLFLSRVSFSSTLYPTFAPLFFLPSPPLFPSVPSPLFSSCCVILILHTLLVWTMNNAWCVRNPQSHAWLPASITELASLLRRWIGEGNIT